MLQNPQNRDIVVAALRHAAPYVRLYRRKTFVIKAGGEVFADPASTRALHRAGGDPAPGGHPHRAGARRRAAEHPARRSRSACETRMVEGRRVTDERTLEVATMVLNGQINTQIVAACRQLDLPAIGVSGVDAGLIRARRRAPVQVAGQAVAGGLRLRRRHRERRHDGAHAPSSRTGCCRW